MWQRHWLAAADTPRSSLEPSVSGFPMETPLKNHFFPSCTQETPLSYRVKFWIPDQTLSFLKQSFNDMQYFCLYFCYSQTFAYCLWKREKQESGCFVSPQGFSESLLCGLEISQLSCILSSLEIKNTIPHTVIWNLLLDHLTAHNTLLKLGLGLQGNPEIFGSVTIWEALLSTFTRMMYIILNLILKNVDFFSRTLTTDFFFFFCYAWAVLQLTDPVCLLQFKTHMHEHWPYHFLLNVTASYTEHFRYEHQPGRELPSKEN